MKKFSRLFLLALCSGFLFLGFSNAQIDGINVKENPTEFNNTQDVFTFNNNEIVDYNYSYYPKYSDSNVCACDYLVTLIFKLFLSGIGIILGILLLALTVNAVNFHKKFKDTQKYSYLPYIPILNLYSISKITIGIFRFVCLILFVGFFCYSIYANIHRNHGCCPNPSRQDYTGIIVGILSIIILSVLISKLNTYFKEHSDKELT